MITPKVLSVIARIVVATLKIENVIPQTDEAENKKVLIPEVCGALFRYLFKIVYLIFELRSKGADENYLYSDV